jgi:hypothetical protein
MAYLAVDKDYSSKVGIWEAMTLDECIGDYVLIEISYSIFAGFEEAAKRREERTA